MTLDIAQINAAFLAAKDKTAFAIAVKDELLRRADRDTLVSELQESLGPPWPKEYIHRENGRPYKPHHELERSIVYSDSPKHILIKGSEGSGKSVAGIVKCLDRIKRGCDGLMISPDLPHFKKSLWPEFQRWCPWDQVDPKHQYMKAITWRVHEPFALVFRNGARLFCGGIDDPIAWEGPNVNFAFMDEMRRKKNEDALVVVTGRVRIPGPGGIPSQIFLTTTPKKHWLYTFFGPLIVRCKKCMSMSPIPIQEGHPLKCMDCGSADLDVIDEYADFKFKSRVITLHIRDNVKNIEEGFDSDRALVLTEKKARVLIDAEWEDEDEPEAFLPHISWWDDCMEELPPLGDREPLILSVDAATGRVSGESDCFAIVGVTRHPDPSRRKDSVAIRYLKLWQAPTGGKIDFLGTELDPGPERELLRLCGWRIDESGRYVKTGKKPYNIKCIVIDPHELNDLAQRFRRKYIAWIEEFGQVERRYKSDTDFLRIISEKRIAHDGDLILRRHIANADRKLSDDDRRMRMVKRGDAYKIDAAVAASQGAYWCLYLQLGG